MHKLTNKQYEDYQRLKQDEMSGRVLHPDGLRMICAANHYDAEKIGNEFLKILDKFRKKGCFVDEDREFYIDENGKLGVKLT